MQKQDDKKKYSLKNLLIWGILGLFVVSGAMQGNVFGMHNPVVAHVGSQKIRVSDIRKYMNLIKVPDDVDRSQPQVQNYIFMKALDLVIQRSLITQECKRLGFVISDKKVIDTIKKQSQFQENGSFSRARFLSELSKLGFSEMQYKSIQKENLLHRQWMFMLESAYVIPERISDCVASASAQKRSGRYMEISHASIKVPKLSNTELAKFYKQNEALFKEDKRRVFKIVEFTNVQSLEKIERLLSKSKFEKAVDSFHGKTYMSDKVAPGELPKDLIRIMQTIELEVGQNSRLFTIENKHYALYFEKEEQPIARSLKEIESLVREEYRKQYIKNHCNPNAKNWVKLVNIRAGENYLGVPDFIVGALFLNKVGKVARYDQDSSTYFVVTDAIVNEKISEIEKNSARDYLSAGILQDVIFASMNSLKLRYKITVLI